MAGAMHPFDFYGKLSGSRVSGDLFFFSADDASRNRKLYPDILALAENTAFADDTVDFGFPTISPSMNQEGLVRDNLWSSGNLLRL